MTTKEKNALKKLLNWCDFDKSGSLGVGAGDGARFKDLMGDVAYNLRQHVNHLKDSDAYEKQGIIFGEAWKRLKAAGIVRPTVAA